MISGFCLELEERCALLGYWAGSCANSLQTFRDNLSCLLKMWPTGCPETSVRNYHYSQRNNPQAFSSLVTFSILGPNIFGIYNVLTTNKCSFIVRCIFIYNIFTIMFRPVIRPSSRCCVWYKNTALVKCVRLSPQDYGFVQEKPRMKPCVMWGLYKKRLKIKFHCLSWNLVSAITLIRTTQTNQTEST